MQNLAKAFNKFFGIGAGDMIKENGHKHNLKC